jgi:hypothetical protein
LELYYQDYEDFLTPIVNELKMGNKKTFINQTYFSLYCDSDIDSRLSDIYGSIYTKRSIISRRNLCFLMIGGLIFHNITLSPSHTKSSPIGTLTSSFSVNLGAISSSNNPFYKLLSSILGTLPVHSGVRVSSVKIGGS